MASKQLQQVVRDAVEHAMMQPSISKDIYPMIQNAIKDYLIALSSAEIEIALDTDETD